MIKVGLIGLGYWGSKLQRYLEVNGNFEVIPVNHSDKEISVVMNDESVSAVVIATPNDTHYALTKLALEYGKNVMCEKPLAFTTDECETLKNISELYNLKLTVEYTFTFSRCIQKMVEYTNHPKYISMNVKHLGRFGGGNVYWLLGSHMLSVLDMIIPLDSLDFSKTDLLKHDGVTETGRIEFGNCFVNGNINLSLNHPYKNIEIAVYSGDNTVIYNPAEYNPLEFTSYNRIHWNVNIPTEIVSIKLDESNNLKYSVDHFYNVITGKETSNLERAIRVTKILESIKV